MDLKITAPGQAPWAYPHMKPNETSFIDQEPPQTFPTATQEFRGDAVGIRPTGTFVLIEPIAQKETLSSGLALPQTSNRKSNEGVVVALGPGRREFDPSLAEQNAGTGWVYLPIDLHVGDRVLYIRWSGHKVEVNSREYYLVDETNVVCVATSQDSELAFWQDHH